MSLKYVKKTTETKTKATVAEHNRLIFNKIKIRRYIYQQKCQKEISGKCRQVNMMCPKKNLSKSVCTSKGYLTTLS